MKNQNSIEVSESPLGNSSFNSHNREIERKIEKARLDYSHEAAPILEELKQNGFVLDQISNLIRNPLYRNQKEYKKALPILLRWLPLIDNLRIKEDIVRTLSVPWASPIAAAPHSERHYNGPRNLDS